MYVYIYKEELLNSAIFVDNSTTGVESPCLSCEKNIHWIINPQIVPPLTIYPTVNKQCEGKMKGNLPHMLNEWAATSHANHAFR